jgi:hypothetical protein
MRFMGCRLPRVERRARDDPRGSAWAKTEKKKDHGLRFQDKDAMNKRGLSANLTAAWATR